MTFKLLSGQSENIAAFEEVVPSGAKTPLHIHRESDEVIHVLSGELMIRLDNQLTTVGAGSWVFIPRGTQHGWRNQGTVPAKAAYMFAPSRGAAFFEALGELGQPITRVAPATLGALSARHGYELVALEW